MADTIFGERADAEWVHCCDVNNRKTGDLFGWADARSATGMLCGYIVKVDHLHLRVRVHNLAAGLAPYARTPEKAAFEFSGTRGDVTLRSATDFSPFLTLEGLE